jgi:ribosomal protein L21E
MTESQRALEAMGVSNLEQRRTPRQSVHASGTIVAAAQSYVAWVKDINESGICLYSQYCPQVGDAVEVKVEASKLPAQFKVEFRGTVTRVQNDKRGAAVGIAIAFSKLGTTLVGKA